MRRPRGSTALANLSAFACGVADVLAMRACQLPTYLADAAVELGFIAGRLVGDARIETSSIGGRFNHRWRSRSRRGALGAP